MTRDEKGRFVKGNGGGPGRPKRAAESEYLDTLASVVSLEDWAVIAKKAKEQAKRGDATARKWLSDYLMGTPVQKQEHSGPGGNPIEIIEVIFPDATNGDESD